MGNGTYMALMMEPESAQQLYDYCKSIGLDNIIPVDELHCTVLFSRKEVPGLKKYHMIPVNYAAKIRGWKQLGDALTLELEFPKAEKINSLLMKMGGTSDFDSYLCHTSVCYDYEGGLPKKIPNFILKYDTVKVEDIKE